MVACLTTDQKAGSSNHGWVNKWIFLCFSKAGGGPGGEGLGDPSEAHSPSLPCLIFNILNSNMFQLHLQSNADIR